MTEIIDSSGNNIGMVEGDGTVYSHSRNRMGRAFGGEVHDRNGSLVGRYDSNGHVFQGTSKIGYIKDGKVFDDAINKNVKKSGHIN